MTQTGRGFRSAVVLLVGGAAALILSGCALRIDHHHYIHLPSPTTQPSELPSADPELEHWFNLFLDGETDGQNNDETE